MNESELPRNQADLPATNQVVYPAAAAKRNLRLEARKATLYSPQRRKVRKEQERNKTVPALPGLVRNPQLASSTAVRAQSKTDIREQKSGGVEQAGKKPTHQPTTKM